MSLRAPGPVRSPDPQTLGLLWAVVVLRVAALGWAIVVVTIDINGVTRIRPAIALTALAVLAAWTVALGWMVRQRPGLAGSAWTLVVDVSLAAVVAGLDHVVYDGAHPQTFASVWPMSAAVVAGLLRGYVAGGLAGLLIGTCAALGTAVAAQDGLDGRWTSTLGTLVLLVVAGVLAGLVTVVLRRADATAARATAREEVARRLHDGVLQTLAVVQRRSQDPELVTLAREQELDLRAFISDDGPSTVPSLDPRSNGRDGGPGGRRDGGPGGRRDGGPGGRRDGGPGGRRDGRLSGGELVAALRQVLAEVERVHGLRGELVVVEVPEGVDPDVVEALHGAVRECLVNVVKHADASRAVVCVDVVDRQLICTVNDDGVGFEPEATAEGTGLRRSVRGRLDQVDGTVELRSRPGHGSEVELRLPTRR